jgi:hypothetical protein
VSEEEREELQVALVDAIAESRSAIALRDLAFDRVVRLSRSLVNDAKLTDEEALRKAFPDALEATLRLQKGA